ncbi:hypothetical protein K443DRAFT_134918 [Laccaria amethystina LaAM-08-1]|uniref:Cytochrome P450 n=1 Tax=Laccaria amethystina LaAM-08-1 TaxID=1095629 RepID=A0A0C9XCD8_9AGAR|nr:hypothetical protein K443DRAFT_134918 [Laccaria amethystina LaAM-08-1]
MGKKRVQREACFEFTKRFSGTSVADYHYTTEKYGHVVRLKGACLVLIPPRLLWHEPFQTDERQFQPDALYITDPVVLHFIVVRNVNIFEESVEFSGLFGIIHHGDGITCVTGSEHRKQRLLINPVFTAAFISKLSPLFYKIAHEDKLTQEIGSTPSSNNGRVIGLLHYMSSAALELIARGGLGTSFNSFNEKNDFHEALQTVLPMVGRIFFVLPYLELWRKMEPVWLGRWSASLVDYVPWPAARKLKWGVDVMHPICVNLFNEKKRILEEGGVAELEKTASVRKDVATLLTNQAADEYDRMSDESVIANISGVVLAGQDTTAGSLTRLMCMMAENPDLQARLRKEILDAPAAKDGEGLNYRELNDLPILDGVRREPSLPPSLPASNSFPFLRTKEDTVVPLHFPIRDPSTGAVTNELFITKGTHIYVGLVAANRSKAIWGPDVHELIGKAVLEATKDSVKMPGIFSNTMTFLAGARACPGMKFAVLQIKLILSVLLPQFSFELVPNKEIEWRLGILVVPYIKSFHLIQKPEQKLAEPRSIRHPVSCFLVLV